MSNIGGGEIIAILLLALLVLGPDRLPTAARQAGKAMRQLRRLSSGFQEEIRTAFEDPQPSSSMRSQVDSEQRRLAAVPAESEPGGPPELETEVIARADPGAGNSPDAEGEAPAIVDPASGDDERATG